ncbi:MAG: SUMF1/EgtB/PvdO family nonheme iron enzyme, partial [bacterium]|nr:SUMF1/EgtB/PvdO family nonheme iron enzyme [bacterium]
RTAMARQKPNKFLPFDNYHVAPIGGIDPDSLKKAARLARTKYRDYEPKLSHNLVLNHIAKSLGFREGWGGYVHDYKHRLDGFMREHGLDSRSDVFAPVLPDGDTVVRLTYRQVADRLFSSGRSMPRRIFVGAGVDVFDLLEATPPRELKIGFMTSGKGLAFADIEPASIDRSVPPASYSIHSPEAELCVSEVTSFFGNLIGDQLCDAGSGERIVAQAYNVADAARERLRTSGLLLRRTLAAFPSGWVDVIPYNDRLAFLRGPGGGYEFVFKGMRDAAFRPNVHAPFLRDKDVSKSEDANEFELHLYFNYCGWLDSDRHDAELAFYANGGSPTTYPGPDEILKAHLAGNGSYVPPAKKAPCRPGYTLVERAGHRLCFSELVTVGRFNRFLDHNPEYVAHRRSVLGDEPLEAVNNEPAHLPAAATWYDAKAYARWIKRTQKLPVRLPTEEEYLILAADLIPDQISDDDFREAHEKRLCVFFDAHGNRFDGHPPYMTPAEFARLLCRYDGDRIEWAEAATGLKTIRSAWFGEWLLPVGAAINGRFMCSQYDVHLAPERRISAAKGRFPASSAGKYKSMKIGFRLVYEGAIGSSAARRVSGCTWGTGR